MMKTYFFSYAYMLWMLACSSGSPGSDRMDASKTVMPSMEESYAQEGGSGSGTETVEAVVKKIIRNGSMTLSVQDALEVRGQIDPILSKHKGYIGNEQLDNNDYNTTYNVQIRVPASQLDSLVADLEGLDATVTYKSIQARDVTEEFIDLETRLANKQAYLEQYRALLKNARSIEDILKVREQIRVLEEEIESVTGRLRYLNNQVDLSTLDLTITQIKDYVYRPDNRINFWERFQESISGGWYGFVIFTLNLLRLWPFLILIVVLIWYVIWWNKRKAAKVPKLPGEGKK